MNIRLVFSSDDRALAIRDHLLPLVRARGASEPQRASLRLVTTLRIVPWSIDHWTPLTGLSPGEASSPGYRHPVKRQRMEPDLPYGLDVQREGAKMLGVLWSDDGSFEVVRFVRGAWEGEALALAL